MSGAETGKGQVSVDHPNDKKEKGFVVETAKATATNAGISSATAMNAGIKNSAMATTTATTTAAGEAASTAESEVIPEPSGTAVKSSSVPLPQQQHRRRKRSRSEEDDTEDPGLPTAHAPVLASDGTVEFSLAAVHKFLICKLCSGYFKDPYTIAECTHSFCKSCLFYAVACGCHECPECRVYLGSDPKRVAFLDHCLQDLVDRVVFPELPLEEEKEQQEFYAARHIPLKAEFTTKKHHSNGRSTDGPSTSSTQRPLGPPAKNHDELEFTLFPEVTSTGDSLPPLDRPCLRISGSFRMNQLKKYLIQKLDLSSASHSAFDILCNGVPLGDEISLSFVKRLLWHHDQDFLTYRIAEDIC